MRARAAERTCGSPARELDAELRRARRGAAAPSSGSRSGSLSSAEFPTFPPSWPSSTSSSLPTPTGGRFARWHCSRPCRAAWHGGLRDPRARGTSSKSGRTDGWCRRATRPRSRRARTALAGRAERRRRSDPRRGPESSNGSRSTGRSRPTRSSTRSSPARRAAECRVSDRGASVADGSEREAAARDVPRGRARCGDVAGRSAIADRCLLRGFRTGRLGDDGAAFGSARRARGWRGYPAAGRSRARPGASGCSASSGAPAGGDAETFLPRPGAATTRLSEAAQRPLSAARSVRDRRALARLDGSVRDRARLLREERIRERALGTSFASVASAYARAASLDWPALAAFFACGFFPADRTFFEDVRDPAAGHPSRLHGAGRAPVGREVLGLVASAGSVALFRRHGRPSSPRRSTASSTTRRVRAGSPFRSPEASTRARPFAGADTPADPRRGTPVVLLLRIRRGLDRDADRPPRGGGARRADRDAAVEPYLFDRLGSVLGASKGSRT